jgi:chromosome segregation ATPase
LSRAH